MEAQAMDGPNETPVAEFMRGFARLARLEYSPERLAELEPEIAALFEDMEKMWATPVGDAEPAISFAVEKIYSHE
jgi:Asp-tRNA(Asn)/Glu-tRNA(Gln) amidotransferase C subunit